MKMRLKKYVACLLAVVMIVATLGVYLPEEAGTVDAAGSATDNPAYMAKLTGAWIWVHQSVKAEAGSVYHFTFDYYVGEGGVAYAKMWRYASANSSDSSVKVQQRLDTDSRSQMELTYTAEDIDNNVMVRFEGDKAGTVFYVWNVRLTKDDSDENLLSNANFEQGDGSWYGWSISGTAIKDETAAEVNGQEIIAFDETILPEGIPTGDPAYMAKIQVPAEQEWIWIYQGITPEVGKTYRFICNYYVEQGSGGSAVMWSDSSKQTTALQTATQGAVEMTYEAVSGDTYLMVRFECAPGTTCYVWNVCLFELDGNRNLLTNGSFSKENGSWIGWKVGTDTTISDKAASDAAIATYGHTIIPFDKSLVPAPAYMAKMKGTHVDAEDIMQTYVDVIQSIQPTADITYTLRADYYDRAADGGASILLWSNTSKEQEGTDSYGRFRSKTKAATEGTLELSYTATDADTMLMIGIECDPETECYFWNLSLTASNSNQNLLANADFQKGIGSWVGWSFGTNTAIKDEAASDAAVAAYGHEIVEFDRELLDSMKAEDALQKTYEDPNTAFQIADVNQYKNMDLENPTYMAKLNGTHVDSSGTTHTWVWVYQGITPKIGTTYQFSCNYYVPEDAGANANAVMWSTTKYDAVSQSMKPGTKGTVELTYEAVTGDENVMIRFECAPSATCYISNICLTEEGSHTNLLRNGDFSEENGSWIGWTISSSRIQDKSGSDAAIAAYGQEILVCDWNLFNSDIADWSVRPQLEETLDFTYQTYINESITDIPEMNFVMHDGTEVIKTEQVTGELGTDGKYRFHLEVLPQQMEHQIIGTLNVQTADGEMTQTKQYSVRDYCVSILKDEGCSAELKSLVADLVRYGGQTQAKFGAQDTLASDLESIVIGFGNEDVLADIDDYVASPVSEEQTGEMYQWKSANLVLNGKVTIRLKFTADNITNLTVKVNNTSYTEDGANKIQANVAGDYYYVDLPVTADSYNEWISANFYVDGEETPSGKELSYSVHTYLYRMKDSAKSKDLYQAIYRYGQSAKAYSDYLATGKEDAVAQEEIDNYLFVSEGNASSRMNPQTGGADEEAKTLRETIMNADDALQMSGNVYYISATNGDDANIGTSRTQAWKTLTGYRANITKIKSGDTVLFERGGVYRGEISDKSILPLVSGVTYGAYGSGAKPAIYGSKQNYTGLGTWTQTDTENIWVCSEAITSDAGAIVFNHGQAVGVKRLKVSDDLATNLAELKSNFEFYHDLDTSKLYLYMDCNPSITFYDIEICENSYMLLGSADSEGITIDNLSLKYGGGHAIRFHQGASNITITNCEIGFIGGSLQSNNGETRYGNGIEFWNGCSDITVENNWIYQIYDAGFTHQGGTVSDGYIQENITFRSNLVEYCSFGLEFWVGNPETDAMKNILYENNLIRFTGYGWGMVRPSTFGVGAINTWGYSDTFIAEECVIRNNIFDLSTRALMVAYYDTMPAVTYIGNSYYLKEGYVALWQKQKLLRANDEDTMKASVDTIDDNPNVVKFIEE